MPELCIACASSHLRDLFSVQTDRTYGVKQCRECRVTATFPRPTPEELTAFYDSSYFVKNNERVGGYSDYAGLPESNAREMWGEFARFAPAVHAMRKRILDYGCATGGFLDEAQRDGWECMGIELSSHAVQRARGFGLKVLEGDIFDTRLSPQSFDVITMWHVLEHVISPVTVLDRACELLSNNGYVLIELPSWPSLGRRLKQAKRKQLRPPEHINFFTPQTLASTLNRCRFKVHKAVSLYPSLTNRITLKKHRKPADFAAGLCGYLLATLGLGGYARVLAQKTG